MSRLAPLLLALLALGVGLVARAGEARRPASLPVADPAPASPLPFDHAEHARAFAALGLACTDCHAVGEALGTAARPEATCHGCHLQEVARASAGAPRACDTCHPVRDELRPANHDAAWGLAHAVEARSLGATCRDCHDAGTCVDCHERRGATAASPHPPGFRAVHGLEARVDPASCGTCHAQATCTACHADGGLVP